MPNNREWALVVWTSVALAWTVFQPSLRRSIAAVLRTALAPKIGLMVMLLVVHVAGEVAVGWHIGLWDSRLAFGTGLWFCTTALVLLSRMEQTWTQPRFVRRKAVEVLGLSTLIEGVSNLAVAPLRVELLLLPVITCIAVLSAVAAMNKEHHVVKRLADGVLVVIVLALIAYSAVGTARSWGDSDNAGLALQLALPVWLTLGVLPLIYAVGLCAVYGAFFTRINWMGENHDAPLRNKVAVIAHFHVRANRLGRFGTGINALELSRAASWREASDVIRLIEAQQRTSEDDALRAQDR